MILFARQFMYLNRIVRDILEKLGAECKCYLVEKQSPNQGAITGSLECEMKLTELLYIFDYLLLICDIFITYTG